MIRPATEEDLPRLMEYADSFLSYHPITSLFPRDKTAVEAMLRKLMEGGNGVLLIHDQGAIGGYIAPMWCAPSVTVATELFWWADAQGRSLMKAFEEWARERGATMIQMLLIVGRKDVSAIYDRAGYAPVELSYVRAA